MHCVTSFVLYVPSVQSDMVDYMFPGSLGLILDLKVKWLMLFEKLLCYTHDRSFLILILLVGVKHAGSSRGKLTVESYCLFTFSGLCGIDYSVVWPSSFK